MSRGISTNRRVTNRVTCLQQHGIDFVCRYYSHTTQQAEKRITPPEADAIVQAGMNIVTVYEDGPTNPGYFSRGRGQRDATHAHAAAQEIQQPAGSAIYFAVDFDANIADTNGPITEYFEGVKDGLTQAGGPDYEIGVYGSGRVCSRIKEDRNLVKYSWLAESTGWAGSGSYATFNIKQIIATNDLCQLDGGVGGDYEDNISTTDYGAFPLVTVGGGVPTPGEASLFVNELVGIAREQFETFHQFSENDPPLRSQIRRFWEEIGFTFPGVETPWSAVLISWCVKTAGATESEFRPSTAHSRFVFRAIQNQNQGVGVFRGRRLDEYRPAVGDILHNNRGGQRLTYDFAAAHEAYESHSAIIVELGSNAEGPFAKTIGGNEGDTIGLKRVPLTDDGFVKQRDANPYICIIQDLKT
jgi:Rv2525c-like, glycoside hydrolase-like domain/Uncharacterized protein conserved in bacteria (DUF2272)